MLPLATSADAVLAPYDVVLCDVWGVVYDGLGPVPEAAEALRRFRARGGRVTLISNSPSVSPDVEAMLLDSGLPRAWDGIVTSGDLTRREIVERGIRRAFHTGNGDDFGIFAGIDVEQVGIEDAEAVIATALRDYFNETPEEYRPVLARGVARGLPLICANPDLVVHVGERLLPCAGALAQMYEEMGGAVFWAGKPHRPIYERALAIAEAARGVPVGRERVVAIGDSIRTDVAGAAGFGVGAVFIAGGIHRDELLETASLRPDALARAAGDHAPAIVATMVGLA